MSTDPATPTRLPWQHRARLITAIVAALVLLAAGIGYVAVNRYTSEIRHVDAFGRIPDALRPPESAGQTILLVGSDRRTGLTRQEKNDLHVGHGDYGPPRTDTVMLVHVSEADGAVTVVSLPRDSYLQIPTHTDTKGVTHPARKNRLNAAYEIGGPGLLVQTVEKATGLRLDHYVEVTFDGFLSVVDALGGVPVCLTKPVNDKASGLKLPAGVSVVSGTQALAYVRARKLDSDFGRMNRQQRFIASIVQKATSSGTLLNPLALNSFLNAAMSSVTTDAGFTRDDMISLGNKLRAINSDRITFFTVPIANDDYRVDIGAARNQSTVLWSDEARSIFARLAADEPVLSDKASTTVTAVRVAPSLVRIKVYNAAGRSGLARQVADDLAKAGYEVVGTPQNAKTTGATTTVIEYDPAFNESLKTLQAAFPNAKATPVSGLGNTFVLLAGSDYSGVRPVRVSATAAGPVSSIKSPTKPRTAADALCR